MKSQPMLYIWSILCSFLLLLNTQAHANISQTPPAPTSEITATVSSEGNQWWSTVSIKLTNTGLKALDVQDSTLSFTSPQTFTEAYGDFSAVSYPTKIAISSLAGSKGFNNLVQLHFNEANWAKKSLDPGKSITLKFGVAAAAPPASIMPVAVYLKNATPPPSETPKGSLTIVAPAAPGADIANQQAIADVYGPNQYHQQVQLNWQQQTTLSNLELGSYQIQAHQVGQYPANTVQQVNLSTTALQQTVSLSYKKPVTSSKLSLVLPMAPVNNAPNSVVYVKDVTAQTVAQTINGQWGQITTIDTVIGHVYQIYTDTFRLNGMVYTPNYSASQAAHVVATETPASVSFSYTATPVPVVSIDLAVSGLPNNAQTVFTFSGNGTNTNHYQFTVTNGSNPVSMEPGIYTLVANEISSDGKTYRASVETSYTITANTTIAIAYQAIVAQEKTFAPYVDFSLNVHWVNNGLEPAELAPLAQAAGVKNFVVAFIVAQNNNTCNATWGGFPEYTVARGFGKQSIEGLRAIGGDVILSFGGLNGTYLSQVCTPTQLVAAYKQVIDTYNATHIDFDVEGAQVTDTAAMQRMINALVIIQGQYPALKIGFTLQVDPKSGLNRYGKNVLTMAHDANLRFDLVNIMTMDYGSWATDSQPQKMGLHAKNSAQRTFEFLSTLYPEKPATEVWGLIGLTPMLGINDVWYYDMSYPQVERFTLADTRDVSAWAKQQGIKFLSHWAITRDHPCTDKNTSNYCSGAVYNQNNVMVEKMQTQDYEFSKTFQQTFIN